MYRTSGSLAFVAAARSVYVVAKDPEDSDRRIVIPVKANLAPDTTGLAYRLTTDSTNTPRLDWEPESFAVDANEVLSQVAVADGSSTSECVDWLRSELATGPMPAKDIKHEAREAGFSDKVLRVARERLKIKTVKAEFSGGWRWCLPTKMPSKVPKVPEDALPIDGAPSCFEGTFAVDDVDRGACVGANTEDRRAEAQAYRAASQGGKMPPGFDL